jgi:arylsulfatase A-like enzyme
VYDGGIRTPAIAHWPWHWEKGTQNAPVSITSWLPTLCKLAGVTPPADLPADGSDISLWLKDGAKEAPQIPLPIYSAGTGYRARMVRLAQWKLIVTKGAKGKPDTKELYNLDTDAGEFRNVIKNHPEEARDLEELLAKFSAGDKAVERGKKTKAGE